MLSIQFPEPDFRRKKEEGREYIFDEQRKRWVLLTPEEWVRQHFIAYLVKVMGYPSALIAVEKEILLGERKKRFDLLVYDAAHQPWMMIECKSMEVALDAQVLEQLLRYHISVPVQYLVITNGTGSYCWRKQNGQLEPLALLPAFTT
jgi:hypothetical protein